MKKLLSVVLILVMVFTMASCSVFGNKTPETTKGGKENKWEDIELPEDQVVFVTRFYNYAWGYVNEGAFIMSNGDVYKFDFSGDYDLVKDKSDQELYAEIIKNNKPYKTIDEDIMKELYFYITKIDKDSKMEGQSEMCDYGENLLEVSLDGKEFTDIYLQGDYTGQLDDKYAKKVTRLFNRKIAGEISK